MKAKKTSIVIIGSGNVATQLAKAFRRAGCKISGVWSRTKKNADTLSRSVKSKSWNKLSDVDPNADFYIVSVNDDSISGIVKKIPAKRGIVLHTSGSIALNTISKFHKATAVLYPLQSIQKDREISFTEIPVLVEGNDKESTKKTEALAKLISKKVLRVDSKSRKNIHLAAVIANNFTNHLIAVSDELLKENRLPDDLLMPLIKETVRKAVKGKARTAQTGPAMRNDKTVINEHLKMLAGKPEIQHIYKSLSDSIRKSYAVKSKNKKK